MWIKVTREQELEVVLNVLSSVDSKSTSCKSSARKQSNVVKDQMKEK